MAKEHACRQCRTLTNSHVCPKCHSTDLSPDWTGLIIITNTQSQIAKALDIKTAGRYALKVS